MRIPKKFLVLLCTVALIVSLMPMSALAATAYNSSVVSNTIPATLTPGQVAYAKIVVKNTGANTWTAARGIQLKETDSLKLLPYAYKLSASDSIKKNQTKTFTVKITAPATAGTYNLSLQMYRNGTKFGAAITKAIIVKSAVKTLSSIAVTKQPTKTSYVIGEALDIAGLEVTGTYSDGSKAAVVVAVNNVTGFDSSKAAEGQVLTITINGKTTTFKVDVKPVGVDTIAITDSRTAVINFNKAITGSSAITAGGIAQNLTITPIGTAKTIVAGNIKASLSADGKVLTLVPGAGDYFKGDYAFTVTSLITDKDGKAITSKSGIYSYVDSVRPTLAGVTYPTNTTARISFSEPINAAAADFAAAMTIVAPTGAAAVTPAAGNITVAADYKSFDLTLTGFTVDKGYSISFVGIADFAGNLITPNPSTVTVTKSVIDSTNPSILSVEPVSIGSIKITYSEPCSNYGTVNTNPIVIGGNATIDSTKTVVTVTDASTPVCSPVLSGLTLVTIAGYADLSTNNGATWTGYRNFVNDTTPPAYSSCSVQVVGGINCLMVKYAEPVKLLAPVNAIEVGTYIDALHVTRNSAAVAIAKASLVNAVNSASDTLKIDISALPAGTYTTTLAASLVSDVNNVVLTTATPVTFTVGAAPTDTNVPVATVADADVQRAGTGDIDLVTVHFDRPVSYVSALNVANYTVEGQQVFQSATFAGSDSVVSLKLIPGIFTIDGLRTFEIKNVATAANVKMADTSFQKSFRANVKPKMISAALKNLTTFTVTFDKAITGGANAFEVYVDGVKLTAGVSSAAVAAASTTVDVTVPALAAGDFAKVYTIKFVGNSTTPFVDGAAAPANAAVIGTVVTATK